MDKILLFAIAGCGRIAKRHAEHINHNGKLAAGNSSDKYGTYQGSMSNHDKVYENLLSIINKIQPPGATV